MIKLCFVNMYGGFGKGLQIISMTEPTFLMDTHGFQMFLDMSNGAVNLLISPRTCY